MYERISDYRWMKEVKCPYCDHVPDTEDWIYVEQDKEEYTCGNCDRIFLLTVELQPEYSCSIPKCEKCDSEKEETKCKECEEEYACEDEYCCDCGKKKQEKEFYCG